MRKQTACAMFVAVVVMSLASAADALTYRLGSIANVRFGTSWTLDGAAMANTRAKLLNPANFGPAGVVRAPVVISDTFAAAGSVTAGGLSAFDAFFIGYLDDADANAFTAAELDAFKTWASSGGTLIVTCDSPAYDAVCASFGYPVLPSPWTPATPTPEAANHPLFSGPFGAVSEFDLWGSFGYFPATVGATVLATTAGGAAQPVVLFRSFGAGRVIFLADVDAIAQAASPGDAITSGNDRFLGNLFAFAFAPYDLMIDAAAHTAGVGNTQWRSDVDVLNLGLAPTTVTIARFIRNQANLNPLVTPQVVPPGQTLRLTDILAALLPASNAGLGVSFPTGAVLANSRFYNVGNPDGSVYGMYVPSIPSNGAVGHGNLGVFHHLSYSTAAGSGSRVNIGFLSRSPFPVQVAARLYGDAGEYLGTWPQTLQPYEHRQLTRIHQLVGTGTVMHGSARVEVLTTGGEVDAYAMLIENISGDPIFMPAELVPIASLAPDFLAAADPARLAAPAPRGAAAAACIGDYGSMVAAAAHTDGVNNTTWLTDVDLYNPWLVDASVDIALLRKNQANPAPALASVSVPAGQTVRIQDILGTLLPASNAGLGIRVCAGDALANARFYNVGNPGGTVYGMYVPALRPEQAITSCIPGALHHLSYSPDVNVGQRVNIGATNGSSFAVDWVIRMYGDDGSLLDTWARTLLPYEHRQYTNIFQSIGAPAVTHGWAGVEVTTPGGVIYPYAMLIQNIGGDPIYVPAVSLPAGTFPTTAALFEGTWTGQWVSAAAGTSGDATLGLDFDLDRQLLNVTLDMDGAVFGIGDLPPLSFPVPLGSADLESSGSNAFGTFSASLSHACNITGSFVTAPPLDVVLTRLDFTGSASSTRMDINLSAVLGPQGGGGTWTGTMTLAKAGAL